MARAQSIHLSAQRKVVATMSRERKQAKNDLALSGPLAFARDEC